MIAYYSTILLMILKKTNEKQDKYDFQLKTNFASIDQLIGNPNMKAKGILYYFKNKVNVN